MKFLSRYFARHRVADHPYWVAFGLVVLWFIVFMHALVSFMTSLYEVHSWWYWLIQGPVLLFDFTMLRYAVGSYVRAKIKRADEKQAAADRAELEAILKASNE